MNARGQLKGPCGITQRDSMRLRATGIVKSLVQPTLLRRILVALTLTLTVGWAIMLGCAAYQAFRPHDGGLDTGLKSTTDGIAQAMAELPTATQVATVAHAMRLYQQSIALSAPDEFEPLAIGIWSPDGRCVSCEDWPLPDRSLSVPAGLSSSAAAGRSYRAYRSDTPRWRVVVMDRRAVTESFVLSSLWHQMGLYLAGQVALVLLPLWIVVVTGLRPLRQLSAALAARGVDDLSPLTLDVRHGELKPVAQALNGLLQRVKDHVARQEQFVQDAAHELRTPLAVVSSQAYELVSAADPATAHDARRRLDAAISRSSHLASQLLDLARLDADRREASAEVDLMELVRDSLAAASAQATAAGISLTLDGPDTLPCTIHRPAFQSVLDNLVHNALRYCPAGSQVQVSVEPRGDGLALAVRDDGPGIPEPDRALIFERFHRPAGQARSGAGLGLAIVRRAAALLGGDVQLTAGLRGRGCAFTLHMQCTTRPLAHFTR
jgi:signal transduction histidine kinase